MTLTAAAPAHAQEHLSRLQILAASQVEGKAKPGAARSPVQFPLVQGRLWTEELQQPIEKQSQQRSFLISGLLSAGCILIAPQVFLYP